MSARLIMSLSCTNYGHMMGWKFHFIDVIMTRIMNETIIFFIKFISFFNFIFVVFY